MYSFAFGLVCPMAMEMNRSAKRNVKSLGWIDMVRNFLAVMVVDAEDFVGSS
jgi:hypothetical protein